MQVHVKLVDGSSTFIVNYVHPQASIGEVKQMIHLQNGDDFEAERLTLSFDGRDLRDSQTLQSVKFNPSRDFLALAVKQNASQSTGMMMGMAAGRMVAQKASAKGVTKQKAKSAWGSAFSKTKMAVSGFKPNDGSNSRAPRPQAPPAGGNDPLEMFMNSQEFRNVKHRCSSDPGFFQHYVGSLRDANPQLHGYLMSNPANFERFFFLLNELPVAEEVRDRSGNKQPSQSQMSIPQQLNKFMDILRSGGAPQRANAPRSNPRERRNETQQNSNEANPSDFALSMGRKLGVKEADMAPLKMTRKLKPETQKTLFKTVMMGAGKKAAEEMSRKKW